MRGPWLVHAHQHLWGRSSWIIPAPWGSLTHARTPVIPAPWVSLTYARTPTGTELSELGHRKGHTLQHTAVHYGSASSQQGGEDTASPLARACARAAADFWVRLQP